MNIKSQILDAIDDINIITAECEYNTICEMYNSYDKASLILEYYEGDNVDAFGVFQESSVSDKMKASGKKYNTFMKILTFIPRLVKALFQTIKEKLKKTKLSKELQQAPKEVKEKLTTVFDKKKDKKKRIVTIASLILGAGAVGVATKVGVDNLSDVDDVEKKAEKIVNIVDNNIEDINKRYKNLVNKLYSHDSMPLPPEDKQSIGVEFNNKKDDVFWLVDKSDIGHISAYCMNDSLRTTDELLTLLIYQLNFHDDINKIDEKINEIFEKFKNKKKENNFRDHSTHYFSKVQLHGYINHLEEVVKDNEKIADEFNKRSDKDKELLMGKQSVQNAIKTLNDESKFYRDIFYEFLSLFHEVTKLIDNTYNNLTYNISDRYKFNEKAEKVSKINTDISLS